MALSLLTGAADAAERFTPGQTEAVIQKVALRLAEPKVGAKASFDATVPDGANYAVESVHWFCDEDNTELKAGDVYGKQTYILNLVLTPNEGYRFLPDSEGFDGTLNGEDTSTRNIDGGKALITRYYALAGSGIASVEAVLAAPRVGAKASFDATVPDGANYAVESVHWFCDEDNTELKAGDVYGKQTYILNLVLTPDEGYWFSADSEGFDGTLNGEDTSTRNIDGGKALITRYYALAAEGPFTDVTPDDYYFDAVCWAYDHEPQITNGIGGGLFGPKSTVTRGEAATFLWRAAGCPEPETTVNPFSDVKETEFWYKPILWANENRIAFGTGNGEYSPRDTCLRAYVIVFLYRMAGEPGAAPNKNNTWYTDAMDWAASIGLLQGTDRINVEPLEDCPRSDVVLYLYRQLAR